MHIITDAHFVLILSKKGYAKNFDLPVKEKILDFELYKKIIDEGSKNGLKAIELGYNIEPLLIKI